MYIMHFLLSFVVAWYPLFDFMVTLLALGQLYDFYYSSAGTAWVSNFISQKLQYVITGPDLDILYAIRNVWPSDLTCGLRCRCNLLAIIFPFIENYTDESWWTLYGKRSVSEHCPVVASIFERFVDDGWCQIGYGNGPMGLYSRLSLRRCPNYILWNSWIHGFEHIRCGNMGAYGNVFKQHIHWHFPSYIIWYDDLSGIELTLDNKSWLI